jgi:hypothetical protein
MPTFAAAPEGGFAPTDDLYLIGAALDAFWNVPVEELIAFERSRDEGIILHRASPRPG